jgi:hypothetical protein
MKVHSNLLDIVQFLSMSHRHHESVICLRGSSKPDELSSWLVFRCNLKLVLEDVVSEKFDATVTCCVVSG